jgi:hypothetical protein
MFIFTPTPKQAARDGSFCSGSQEKAKIKTGMGIFYSSSLPCPASLLSRIKLRHQEKQAEEEGRRKKGEGVGKGKGVQTGEGAKESSPPPPLGFHPSRSLFFSSPVPRIF